MTDPTHNIIIINIVRNSQKADITFSVVFVLLICRLQSLLSLLSLLPLLLLLLPQLKYSTHPNRHEMVRKDKLLNHTTIAASSSTTMTTTAATESSGTAADTAIHTDEDAPTDKPIVVVPQQDHDDDGVVVVVMPVKRPKGRPRKVPVSLTSYIVHTTHCDHLIPSCKRCDTTPLHDVARINERADAHTYKHTNNHACIQPNNTTSEPYVDRFTCPFGIIACRSGCPSPVSHSNAAISKPARIYIFPDRPPDFPIVLAVKIVHLKFQFEQF